MNQDDYLHLLQALLPQGAAWPRDSEATLTKTLAGFAVEFARVEGRAYQLVSEADPRLTSELINEWETMLGLPDPCVGADQSLTERRRSLLSKLTTIGGQSRQYFIDLAASLGSVITITEFAMGHVNDPVNYPMYGLEWRFAWQVNGIANPVTYKPVNGAVNDPLAIWGTTAVQCLFNRLKPAHTTVLYNYT